MEQRRQLYCVAIGVIFVLAAGLLTLVVWHTASAGVFVSMFDARLCRALLGIGLAILLLGILGGSALCCWNQYALCGFAWGALICSVVSFSIGCYLFLDVVNSTIHLDRTCQDVQLGIASSHLPQQVDIPQQAYASLLETLNRCREQQPLALRLDSCPKGTNANGSWWQDNPYKDVFRAAETMYSCSGFCFQGVPLFALPDGTVNEDNKLDKRPACFAPLSQEVRDHARFACWVLVIDAIVLILPVCCACWLVCAPPPKRRRRYVHRTEELEWTSLPVEDAEDDEYDS